MNCLISTIFVVTCLLAVSEAREIVGFSGAARSHASLLSKASIDPIAIFNTLRATSISLCDLKAENINNMMSLRGGKSKLKVVEEEESFVAVWIRRAIGFVKQFLGMSSSRKRYGINKKRVDSSDHLTRSYKPGEANARIQKELKQFLQDPPENCKLEVGSNIRQWIVTITGANNTIYAGEKYKLKMVFPKDYPTKPPGVYFLKPSPKHQHVYSNGDICLNLLGRDWRPTMSAQILAASILSMLSNAKEKKLPQDNAMHADMAPGQQQDNWMYHDDKC